MGKIPRIYYMPRLTRLTRYAKARLYAPEIAREFVQRFLTHYGLELMAPPENLPFGRRTHNVVVHTSGGKKVLKLYREEWQIARIVHEHSILKYLEEINFPALRLTLTQDGESFVEQDGHLGALYNFAAGTNFSATYIPPHHRRKLYTIMGKTLARFHRQTADFLPAGQHHLGFESYTGDRWRDLKWHLQTLHELQEKSRHLADPDAQWLCQKSAYIGEQLCQLDEQLQAAQLPRTVIHGDFGIHNTLLQPEGTIALLDFELARLEWRLIDLVILLSRLGVKKSRLLITPYQAEYPLNVEESRLFPQVWQYYMLRGAVQYWQNYFELGGDHRFASARRRVERADWAEQNWPRLWWLNGASAKRPLRVMMVARLFYPWVGGAERQAHKLAQALVEKETAVEIVTGWWFRGTPQRELLDGIPVYRNLTLWEFFGIKGLRKFGGYLYILSLIWYLWRRRDEYDLIHVHGLNYHTFAAVLAGRWFKCKVICKLANSGEGSDILKMRRDKQLALSRYMLPAALHCDRFVALNKKVVEELTAVQVPPQNIIQLPNGVETDEIVAKSNYALHHPACLVFVGRLHPQKGLDTLLQAIQQLRQQYAGDLQLQLLGDGPLREELVQLAEQLGITPWVDFRGQSDQVMAQLQQADIFVLPSRAEGISNALLEAMASGLPAVVSQIPGNVDVIEHGENGLLFTVDKPERLAERLLTLLTQPDLREQLGRKARQTVVDHYSLNYVAGRYITLYESLLTDEKTAVSQTAQ